MNQFWLALYYAVAYHLPSRYFPLGIASGKLRTFLVKRLLGASCGKNLEIESGVLLGKFDDIRLGDDVQINERCRLRNVYIGNAVMIAPEVYIPHSGHGYADISMPMRFQGETHYQPTIIEDDVWIGARAMIMPGRKIGKGSIVAAGSVVVKDVAQYTIVGGNPATMIKKRT